MFDFKDQVALITGASRGIGRRVAEDLAAEGASVIVTSRSREAVDVVAGQLAAQGKTAVGMALDVACPEQVKIVVAQIMKEQGRIDILINNAGITRDGLLMRMKDGDWEAVLATNLKGAFLMAREVVKPMLRQRYGRIVNVTSVAGQMGNAGQANYVASKAGLIGFTKALAREVASRNITVNAVAPGFIATDMTAKLEEKAAGSLTKQIPAGRIGSVADVSYGIRLLAAKEAGYITGHVLNMNGGLYM